MKGFQIGPTVNACTKGIWMWSQPIPYSEDLDIILLDTEGLNSIDRDQTLDMKIFTLSVLLSSVFVYNSIGHIDETALENLSLVVDLSKHIGLNSEKKNTNDGEMSQYFPYFFWVLRDFSLDLKGKNSTEYLEQALQLIPSNIPEAAKKNKIREKNHQLFPI